MAAINKPENSIEPKASWIGLTALFLGLIVINHFVLLQRTQFGLQKSAFYDTPKKILGSAFREVRVTIADILWVKVDTYFHAAITPEEHEQIHPGHPEHMLGISHINPTLAGTQFLPLIRLIVDLDPNFIEAYSTGGWWLWNRLNQVQEAINFFNEGIKNNPDNYQLHYDLGWLYFWKLADYNKSKETFIAASKLATTDRDKSTALEFLAYSYERLNDNANAITVWEQVEKLNVRPYVDAAKRRLSELRSLQKNPSGK